jgi:hypothetical protein
MEIKLTLTLDEVQALMDLMGETPAKMGFFPLMAKIKMQADPQTVEKAEVEVVE